MFEMPCRSRRNICAPVESSRVGRYRDLHGLEIVLDESARTELIRRGFSPVFGARHLAKTLDSICNVEVAKRIRQDDTSTAEDRGELIGWLREMRAGERPFAADEVRQRVLMSFRKYWRSQQAA